MYLFDDGFVFGCPTVVSETTRFTATLLLSCCGKPFRLSAGGVDASMPGAVVRPLVTRRLTALDAQMLSIGLTPNHRDFRSFIGLPEPGFLPVAMDLFAAFSHEMDAMYRGELTGPDAGALTDRMVAAVAERLPRPKPLDERIQHAVDRLASNHQVQLDQLAGEVGLSYDRMSHLFSESMGLPMRSYVLALKIHGAARLLNSTMSITDVAHSAGFSDSSHLARVWTRAFGGAPSYFFGSPQMRVVSALGERPAKAAAACAED